MRRRETLSETESLKEIDGFLCSRDLIKSSARTTRSPVHSNTFPPKFEEVLITTLDGRVRERER